MKILHFCRKLTNKISSLLRKPGDLFRFGSPSWREKYFLLSKFFRRKELISRSYNKNNSNNPLGENGYAFLKETQPEQKLKDDINSAVLFSNLKIDQYLSENMENNNSKDYLQSVLSKEELELNDPLVKLAMNNSLVNYASNYLGMTPIVGQIQLWYSPNNSKADEGSQFFHLDYADVSQFKVFIFVNDIDENTGPLTFISALDSEKIVKKINYKLSNKEIRVPDEIILDEVHSDDWIKGVGSKGQILCVDTCKCMHFGSRHASKPRRMLMIQYISPFSFTLPLNYRGNTFLSDLFINEGCIGDELSQDEKLLIGIN